MAKSIIPQTVLMVRPAAFGFNAETAVNNAFQHKDTLHTPAQIQSIALQEFDEMVSLLQSHGIEVMIYSDDAAENTPDSIFPNNWFSTFTDELLLYSMFTENRRRERKQRIYQDLSGKINKSINDKLLSLEPDLEILEGTGSLVCDYKSKTAFAAISDRTHHKALDLFEEITGYDTARFEALGPDGQEIYHTNVMMCMADEYVVIGLNTIIEEQREFVKNKLTALNKEIIHLSNEQVFNSFAGNMLQLANHKNEKFIVMSSAAKQSLTTAQLEAFETHNNSIISPQVPLIESIGGGSVRCMMAEIFTHE